MPLAEPKCKYCRRVGEKLFLKGERCHTPKCASVRKPYRPGAHGKRFRRVSEYGRQLLEKQKIRWVYGLSEKQFRRYFNEATKARGVVGEMLVRRLELRLDNAVFRIGLAPSRAVARQLVSHRHVLVNGRPVNIPSLELKEGDVVTLRESSKSSPMFENLSGRLKNYNPPAWLSVDKKAWEGTVKGTPTMDGADVPADVQAVIEFYSR